MRRSLVVAVAAALVLAAPASARLTKADRAAIDRTFDAFVPSAVERRDPAASYDLVTAQFRGGATRAQWASGNIPVFPYQARGRTFHGWSIDYIQGNEVAFELMLQPRNPRGDAIAFDGSLKKVHGRWLIDSFNPSATFAGGGGAKVVGPTDFTAQRSPGGDAGDSRLSAVWFIVPGVVFALILMVPIGFLAASWRRGRTTRATAEERQRYDEFWERLRARSSAS
jgi:hypothetical protein